MLRRHRNLFSYSLECLKKYRMRTTVILIAFTVAVSMLSSVFFVKDGLEREAEMSVAMAPDITVEYLKGGRLLLTPSSYADAVKKIDGVEKVAPRIWGYAGISVYTFTVIGLDLSSANVPSSVAATLAKGRFLRPSDAGTGAVVVGQLLAGMLDLDVGSSMILLSEAIKARKFEVVGIFSGQSSIYTADLIVMSIEDARRFFEIPEGYVTDVCVYVREDVFAEEVAAKISTLPNSRVVTRDLLLRGYKYSYASRGGIYTTIWTILLVAVTLISFSQAIIVGHESRFEVGLLKTFGFTTLDIIEIRLIESMTLGLFAASLGMIIGAVYSMWFNAAGLADILLGWAFLPRQFKIPVHISSPSILAIYSATVIPLLFATVVPAWLNAITDPEIAMRRAAA